MAEKKSTAKADAAAGDEAGAAAAKKKKLMIIGAGVALLLLIGGAAAFFLLGGKKDEAADKAKAEAAAAPPPPPIYASLGQTFTITLASADRPRYMKVAISAMSHEKEAVDGLELHSPLVRSRLVGLLGAADFEKLRTDEGKQLLRADVLKAVQEVLQAETGKPGVEQVYFTEFVLQ
jgi:flagellar FliL protein